MASGVKLPPLCPFLHDGLYPRKPRAGINPSCFKSLLVRDVAIAMRKATNPGTLCPAGWETRAHSPWPPAGHAGDSPWGLGLLTIAGLCQEAGVAWKHPLLGRLDSRQHLDPFSEAPTLSPYCGQGLGKRLISIGVTQGAGWFYLANWPSRLKWASSSEDILGCTGCESN